MKTQTKYSPEVRERAVRLVLAHQGEHDSQRTADRIDCGEDRLHGRDTASVGAPC